MNSPTDIPTNQAVAAVVAVVAVADVQADPKSPAIPPRNHPMKKADAVKAVVAAVTKVVFIIILV